MTEFHLALFDDTRPEARAVLIDLLRQAPPWKKLRMVCQLNARMKHLALTGLRQRHPAASEEEIQRRLADLLLGEKVAEMVYGPLISATDTADYLPEAKAQRAPPNGKRSASGKDDE